MSETELKLSVTEENLEAAHQWLLGRGGRPAGAPLSLRNRYFDTPDGQLNHERVALRLRETGEQIIQTLKTRGHMQSGAMAREEWEWNRDEPSLDLGLLDETPLAGHPSLDHLVPCFDTDFQRRVLDLTEVSEQGHTTEIECALDKGVIRTEDAEIPLLEVELELKSGDALALGRVARDMVSEVPALLNGISKAEQGYCLAGIHRFPEPEGDAVERWVMQLCQAWQCDEPNLWPELLEAHHQIAERARAKGAGALFSEVTEALKRAAEEHRSPRSVLVDLPGLAALQLTLVTD
ncbi:CYTH domain-containing protein [Halospina denitrificans]|uniref:CYTH domain-containing protein n=1 Tax=Halospina denitrificans TaxID=332522 RepID=A0A4R7JGR4_9GAMM|nr:CYTH domain-containing protein [Halospina denitrificans]TDT37002.1 CYTH domain-containing protein [Halospina denitrificans]